MKMTAKEITRWRFEYSLHLIFVWMALIESFMSRNAIFRSETNKSQYWMWNEWRDHYMENSRIAWPSKSCIEWDFSGLTFIYTSISHLNYEQNLNKHSIKLFPNKWLPKRCNSIFVYQLRAILTIVSHKTFHINF